MFDLPEYRRIILPTAVDPVNATQSTSRWSARDLPGPSPNPGRTLKTPSGISASAASSAIRIAVSGDFSDGFRMTLLPVASAGPIFQAAINNGKFHGTIQATTPTGSRVISPILSWAVGATSS